jgi:N2227-like protein
MRTSFYLTRFLTLLLCVVFPLYLALRASAWLSDVLPLLSPLSERAKALHAAFMSPIAAPRAPISQKDHLSPLPDRLAHCINSLEQYQFLAEQVIQRKYARYAKQTPAQKTICNTLGYPAHFEKASKGIEVNARFSQLVAQMAREDYRTGPRALENEEEAEFEVVSQMLGHLVRDWSTQGAKERQIAFPPVLHGLEQHFGGNENGRGKRVLVPGSGMGRLASDIADLGTSTRHLC